MTVANVLSRATDGLAAPPVSVQVHLSGGLPVLSIVGLPEAAVRESKDRVRSAILNARFKFPEQRITVNLAPADLPKQGGRFDLPIATGILVASGQLPAERLPGLELYGELSLDGSLRGFPGALPLALAAREEGRMLVLPRDVAREGALVPGAHVLEARHLLDVAAHLAGREMLTRIDKPVTGDGAQAGPDLSDVLGQDLAKRALEVAAAGAHGLLMSGPPGTGKSMLASRLPGILPPLTENEALEVAAIASLAGDGVKPATFGRRPFRNPHHTASPVAVAGGGALPRPGEVTLAHHGVLFLDELPEFRREVLEVLREPLETGEVRIARARRRACFPARFQLVAAMNPCACGYLGDGSNRCSCTPDRVRRYRGRLSGPLLDRLDIQVQVSRPPSRVIIDEPEPGPPSEEIASRVGAARRIQLARQGMPNGHLDSCGVRQQCRPGEAGQSLLEAAVVRLGLSMRAAHKILKVSRTIADLAGSAHIGREHIAEAVTYRRLELPGQDA